MADETVSLGTTPEALKNRFVEVTLQDGSVLKVHKWSNQKFAFLVTQVADVDSIPKIAEESVAEADREKVRALDFVDLMAIKVAATDLNFTEAAVKNFLAHLRQGTRLADAIRGKSSPSNPS